MTTDILARVSVYLLSDPSVSFAPLLRPLLTPQSIPETLIVILLDWSSPWTWVRELREWIRLLRSVLISLDDETKLVMEEVMTEWRDRKRGLDVSGTGVQNSGGPVTIPLGPGEWDEGLGVPLCVVCQGVCTSNLVSRRFSLVGLLTEFPQADKIEKLEKEHGWREEEFDFILQFMRTILLKRESLPLVLLCRSFISDFCFHRRCIAHLHDAFSGELPTESDSFITGNTFALKTAIA